jgi:hypothetical protein
MKKTKKEERKKFSTFLVLNLDDLPREIGKESAEAVATVFMSWRLKLTDSWGEKERGGRKHAKILVSEIYVGDFCR